MSILLCVFAQPANAIRAGLDFTFIAQDGNTSKKITCDFCGHKYSDNIYFSILSVNTKEGHIMAYFSDSQAKNKLKLINPKNPIESFEMEFYVDSFHVFKVNEGQTIKLKDTIYTFKLLKAFGGGCPIGAQC